VVEQKTITLHVYGAEQLCPSCIGLPSSKETASWLEAALGRRYGKQVEVKYVDIFEPETEEEALFSKKVIEEDLWYPVVVLDGEILAEGNPKLKTIYAKLEQQGIVPLDAP
jgi:disulfide oxidoreductase YuzD